MKKAIKIATLTFHRAINYGAILQTYALQKSIELMGYNTEVLDYRSEFLEALHNPHNLKLYRTPLHFLYALLRNRIKKDNRKAFREFQSSNIKTSSLVYDRSNIKNAECKYDAIIVGSDQVWNHHCTHFDKTYFLNFVENSDKKYSYAASIGINLENDDIKREYKGLLEDFKVLSVREEQGKNELAKIGLDSKVSLDPTLLLSKSQWLSLMKRPSKLDANTRFLLVYVIVETPTIFQMAKEIADKLNLKIVYINEMRFNKHGVKNLNYVTPNEWLWLFANADFIVTNSFHGTAFSVNFEKQFFVEPLPVKTNVNSRIYDFLGMFGLQNRVVDKQLKSIDPIDYAAIDLQSERAKSLEFLKDSLEFIEHGE